MSRRRRRPSSPSPAPALPLEDDDLLDQILLRLPPQPPYLLRASLVSTRWRRLATDPQFLRRFRIHHRKPPLLGEFSRVGGRILFTSTIDPPYRIPPDRFSLRVDDHRGWALLDCRHGRVLVVNRRMRQLIVWDPITGDRSLVAAPPEFGVMHTGDVLCAAGDKGHVHGACHSIPFKLVLLSRYVHGDEASALASVYSSETGIWRWSGIISTTLPHRRNYFSGPGTLVGNTLHWLLTSSATGILELDLDRQSLAVTERPHGDHQSVQIIRAEDGGVGLAILSCPHDDTLLQMWERKVDSNGVDRWVLRKTVELQKVLGLRFKIDRFRIASYAEEVDTIIIILMVHQSLSTFMVQLDSLQPRELRDHAHSYYPFTSFYTEGPRYPKKLRVV